MSSAPPPPPSSSNAPPPPSTPDPFPLIGRVNVWPVTFDGDDLGRLPSPSAGYTAADISAPDASATSMMDCATGCAARKPYCQYFNWAPSAAVPCTYFSTDTAINPNTKCTAGNPSGCDGTPYGHEALIKVTKTDDDSAGTNYIVVEGFPKDGSGVVAPTQCALPITDARGEPKACTLKPAPPQWTHIVSPSGRIEPSGAYTAMTTICDTDPACNAVVTDMGNTWGALVYADAYGGKPHTVDVVPSTAVDPNKSYVTWVKAGTASDGAYTATVNGKTIQFSQGLTRTQDALVIILLSVLAAALLGVWIAVVVAGVRRNRASLRGQVDAAMAGTSPFDAIAQRAAADNAHILSKTGVWET